MQDDKLMDIYINDIIGTVGRNAGREHIAGDSTDVETEKQNIQQQYLMAQALEEISNQNIARHIAIAEKIYLKQKKLKGNSRKGKDIFPFIVNIVALSLPTAI